MTQKDIRCVNRELSKKLFLNFFDNAILGLEKI